MTAHRLLGFAWLVAIGAAPACAASSARPQHAAANTTATRGDDEASARAQDEPARASRRHRREMTWDEYYGEIAERARKRGVLVMWFNPPSVHCVADVQLEQH